ncbi:MAG: YetF domain-containing protein [Parasphingorhabdus sp.]|uniref:DUF421 domain-containing protein n=1 Tax=Parasphingorhabdus sp. TaxID=2709688 RepID=UPI00300375A8
MPWLSAPVTNVLWIALSAILVYVVLVALTRLAGIRSFSKMSGFDFAITVAIGSVIASVVIAKDPPVANGAAALVMLFAIQIGFAALRSRFSGIEALADNKPRLIMIGNEIQFDQLKKSQMTESDLMAKLREANVFSFSQVTAVIAETTGDVSVLHSSQEDARLHRKITTDVIGADRLGNDRFE